MRARVIELPHGNPTSVFLRQQFFFPAGGDAEFIQIVPTSDRLSHIMFPM